MAVKYTEFDTTQANLLTDLQTAILGSTDWTRPNAVTFPNLYKAVAPSGAQLIVDFTDTAITTSRLNIAVWRAHDGTTGTDKLTRSLFWRRADGSTTAQPVHVTVSVGPSHIFVQTEGAYPGETGFPENTTYGSIKTYFYIAEMMPYFDITVDPVPVVIAGGFSGTTPAAVNTSSWRCYASRNTQNTFSWRSGVLGSVQFPNKTTSINGVGLPNVGADEDFYLFPYVYFDEDEGMRGRLSNIFFAGWNYDYHDTPMIPIPPVGAIVTYNGQQYKLLTATKNSAVANEYIWSSLGASHTYNTGEHYKSIVIAVPYSV
jgi:hypothetical protein